METYRITDWGKHFEKARTRELKSMTWLSVPTKMDGDGYTELVGGHPNGAAHYGVWMAIVLIASKCEPRGVLVRGNGLPHDSASLARISRMPAAIFDEVIPRLLEIGWLETQGDDTQQVEEISHNSETISQQDAAISQQSILTGPDSTGPDSTGQTKPGKTEPHGHETRPGSGSGIFKDLDLGTLRDGRRLLEWFMRAVGTRSPPFADTPADRLKVFAAAERALEVGKNPPAFFAAIVGKRDWGKISNEQEDRARNAIRKLNGEITRTSNLDEKPVDVDKVREEQIRKAKERFGK